MASPLLDFRKFKHVKSDEKTTTLRHADGHLVKIMHKALGKDAQTQLKKMAEGGDPKVAIAQPTRETTKQARSINPDKVANTGGEGASSLSDAWNKIQNAWEGPGGKQMAEGGPTTANPMDASKAAQASQRGGTPSDSPIASGDWSHIWKANGGKVAEKAGGKEVHKPEENTIDSRKEKREQNSTPMDDLRKEHRKQNNAENNRPILPSQQSGAMPRKKRYADGGETSLMTTPQLAPQEQSLPCLNPNCKSHGKPHPNCRCYGPMAKGGEVVHYCRYGFPHQHGCEYAHGGEVNHHAEGDEVSGEVKPRDRDLLEAIESAPQDERGMPIEETPGKDVNPEIVKELATEKQSDSAIPDTSKQDIENEVASAQQAGGNAVIPEPPQAQSVSQNAPQGATPMAQNPNVAAMSGVANQAAASMYQPEQARKEEAAHLIQDANHFGADNLAGNIKPKTYADLFHERGTMGKLASIFGVIMGGIGSGLTHQPNAAIAMMDKIIDRDLDAQKQNVSNKQNMWNKTYEHMLQEAHARGADVNSQLVQAEAAEKTNTVARMYQDQGFLGQMANKISSMPEGASKEAAKKALYFTAQQVDLKHATLADQLSSRLIMMDKSGKSWNSIQNLQNQGPQTPQEHSPTPKKPSIEATKTAQAEKGKEKPQLYHVLAPGAQGRYNDVMNDLDPMWSKSKDLINQQFTQAQQVEKILNGPGGNGVGGIHDLMSQMHDAQNKMGYYGHFHGKLQDMGEALPIIGGAAGAATQLMPDTASEKKFNALKSTLAADLGSALQGLMTPTEINHTVSKYAPAYQDTPEDVAFKEKRLTEIIKKAIRTAALTGAGGFLKQEK